MKRVSSKRNKTDADFAEMAKIEWYASLYVTKDSAGELRICLPSDLLEASFINGSKKRKLGKQAQAGMFVNNHAILNFDGSELSIDQLFERDENRFTKSVKIQRNKVMRTRFIVENWKTDVEIVFDDKHFNEPEVKEIVEITGDQIGFGDWRPKFGRFRVAA